MYVLIFGIAIYGIFIFMNKKFINTNFYQNDFRQVNKFLNGVPYDLEIVNTGSSYAKYGLDYSSVDIKGFNFALRPQSLNYDFKLLKYYQEHMKQNCKVIIVLPELVFGFVDFEYDLSNRKYYYFFDKNQILGYDLVKYLRWIKYPILSSFRNIKYVFFDIERKTYWEKPFDSMSYTDSKKFVESRILGWKNQFKLADMENEESSKHLEDVFIKTRKLVEDMISFCKENGFEPILLIPPVSKVLNDEIGYEFLKAVLYKNIELLNSENLTVLDYLYDDRFQSYKLYSEGDLLNSAGRKLFTEVVLNDLGICKRI